MSLPPPLEGTELRILATSDLGATTVPLRMSGRPAMELVQHAHRPERISQSPTSNAVIPAVASHLSEWLAREIDAEPAGVGAVAAPRLLLERGSLR